MVTHIPARGAMALAIATILAASSPTPAHPARMIVSSDTAESLDPGDILRTAGPGSMAAHVQPQATLDAEGASFLNDGGGTPAQRAFGVFVADGGGLSLVGGYVQAAGAWGIGVQAQGRARVDLTGTQVEMPGVASIGLAALRESEVALDGVTVRVDGRQGVALSLAGASRATASRSRLLANGDSAAALVIESGEAIVRDTLIEGMRGHAVSTPGRGDGTAIVRLERSHLRGHIASSTPGLEMHAVGSRIEGDVVRRGTGRLALHLADGTWRGRADRLTVLSLTRAEWALTGDSHVDAVRIEHGGRIDIGGGHPLFRTLHVGSWHAEPGAVGLTLGTRLDAGGARQRQATDRLLVAGDAVGRTLMHVTNVGGRGANTAGRNGANGPGDGISIVQVGGDASAESFHLAGGYVAVGPWQYRLHAFGPGTSDPAQRLVEGAGGYWDYRLQSVRAGAATRAAFVPQVPAYLVLGHALFGYGRTAIDALDTVGGSSPDTSALRVRTFGGNAMYRGAPRAADGMAYRRDDRGMQITGEFMLHRVGDNALRSGISLSAGTIRATPRVVDGRSDLRAQARGIAWHAAFASEDDWQTASYLSHTRYRVDAHTPSRGQLLSRLRAATDEAMLSSKFLWRPTQRLLVEPGVSVLWQRLRAERMRDGDGVDVSIGAPRRVTLRGGARASMSFAPDGPILRSWSPYIDLRYGVTRDARTRVHAGGELLPAARAGHRVDIAAGAAFELGERWTARADATASLGRGRGAETGRTLRLGAAWAF